MSTLIILCGYIFTLRVTQCRNAGNDNYLLIANSKEVKVEEFSPWGEVLTHRTNYHSISYLYKWKEYNFDVLQQRVLPGVTPRAVTHFTIGSRHFIAMANFRNNKGQN